MSTFIFNNQRELGVVHRAEVPAGIQGKAALLDALSSALLFPDYFGANWDALEECIRDLSWLPEGDVVLQHRDLPLLEDRTSLATYISILKDAADKWNATQTRRLLVVFPPETEKIVLGLLPDA